MAHPLKFLETASATANLPDAINLKTDVCKESVRIFELNIVRALNLCALPGFTFWFGVEWAGCWGRARMELLPEAATPKQIAERAVDIETLGSKYMAEALNIPARDQRERIRFSTTEIEKHIGSKDDPAWRMLENQLQSVVIQAWTAFEYLISSMLRQTVSKFPLLIVPQIDPDSLRFGSRDAFRACN